MHDPRRHRFCRRRRRPEPATHVSALVRSMNLRTEPLASAEEFLSRYAGEPGVPGGRRADARPQRHRAAGGAAAPRHGNPGDRAHGPRHTAGGRAGHAAPARSRCSTSRPTKTSCGRRCEWRWPATPSRAARRRQADLRARLASLSDKERDVLQMIVAGRPNKAMANAHRRQPANRRKPPPRGVLEAGRAVGRGAGGADAEDGTEGRAGPIYDLRISDL